VQSHETKTETSAAGKGPKISKNKVCDWSELLPKNNIKPELARC
jgi:hypothetical protein